MRDFFLKWGIYWIGLVLFLFFGFHYSIDYLIWGLVFIVGYPILFKYYNKNLPRKPEK